MYHHTGFKNTHHVLGLVKKRLCQTDYWMVCQKDALNIQTHSISRHKGDKHTSWLRCYSHLQCTYLYMPLSQIHTLTFILLYYTLNNISCPLFVCIFVPSSWLGFFCTLHLNNTMFHISWVVWTGVYSLFAFLFLQVGLAHRYLAHCYLALALQPLYHRLSIPFLVYQTLFQPANGACCACIVVLQHEPSTLLGESVSWLFPFPKFGLSLAAHR